MSIKNKLIKLTMLVVFLLPTTLYGASYANHNGYILLQIEKNGEAWYLYPNNGNRYYLGRPDDAFIIMKKLALGTTHNYISKTEIFPARLSGLILLDVEKNGEAYYIYPKNNKKYYLGRPADAFRIMSQLGLGISNSDLAEIPIGEVNNVSISTTTISTNQTSTTKKVLQDVPFTSQAPYGDWKDLRQEDGCEEASSLMAIKWAGDKTLSRDTALKEIIGASDYILKKYQEYRDVSVNDILNWLIKDYFNYQKAAVKNNISLDEIIAELNKGNIIIAPMNGQLLKNPYYTQPGPINHMIVIRGYDPLRKIFITNDPGTRHGELYEYDSKLLYNSIRAYPTGNHEPITGIKKDVIVVWK